MMNEAQDVNKIRILIQPDRISDDDICDLLHEAHQSTLDAGMHYSVLNQTGKDIRRRIGENGVFFVAVDEDDQPAGVLGVSFYEKSSAWYAKGKPYAEVKLGGVRQAYKGMGIYSMLLDAIYPYAFERVDVLTTNTAVQNTIIRKADEKRGWVYVDFVSWTATDYYSVVMAKWKDTVPYNRAYCLLRYTWQKCRTVILKNRSGQYRRAFELMRHRR